MRKSVRLLAGQDKAALLGAGKSGVTICITNGMAIALGHQFRRALQALFGLDHLARREAIFAAPVLAQFHQIGRVADRARHRVELVDAVAMAVRELRQIAAREGRLLLRDRVQCNRRIADKLKSDDAERAKTLWAGNGKQAFAMEQTARKRADR